MRNTALVVVDVQNDFADPGGSLYVRGGEDVVRAVNLEVAAAEAAGAFVCYTQDWHPSTHAALRGGWTASARCNAYRRPGALPCTPPSRCTPVVRKGDGDDDGYSGSRPATPAAAKSTRPRSQHCSATAASSASWSSASPPSTACGTPLSTHGGSVLGRRCSPGPSAAVDSRRVTASVRSRRCAKPGCTSHDRRFGRCPIGRAVRAARRPLRADDDAGVRGRGHDRPPSSTCTCARCALANFLLACGLTEVLDYLESLRSRPRRPPTSPRSPVSLPDFLERLAQFRFTAACGRAEGTPVFATSR